MRVHSLPVLGNRQAIPNLVTERGISLVIIAIHNISGPDLRAILSLCLVTAARVKILPDVLGMMDSSRNTLPLKDITPVDLLGRQPHRVDEVACRELIAAKEQGLNNCPISESGYW